ncbi:MoaD/ThiS family protein [Auraticoccus monumenti]|uniref:Molybdopterin converting factor, small subunit n=1 Tax=Auraticoccus monumenti TaxID=675864 RepID=A0A1G7F275_9ACTN|nr:MoaD/ThiS family protein [Auraticoccus monumenti]SDE70007.1 Molybdopterin converting factor, small subunit [Auraticoccus monumenti]
MHRVTLRYWAGARAAAGVETEDVRATTVAEALEAAMARRPGDAGFARVLGTCSLLRDRRTVPRSALDTPLDGDTEVEVLPPFAGG